MQMERDEKAKSAPCALSNAFSHADLIQCIGIAAIVFQACVSVLRLFVKRGSVRAR